MRKDTVFRLKDILSQQFMFWKQNMEYEKEWKETVQELHTTFLDVTT
jgi:predicted DNA-binding ArsR family transcriptional regulator